MPSDWSAGDSESKSAEELALIWTPTLVPLITRSLSLGSSGVNELPPPWLSYSSYRPWSAAATLAGSGPGELAWVVLGGVSSGTEVGLVVDTGSLVCEGEG